MNKYLLSFFWLGLVFLSSLHAQPVHWEPTGGFSGGRAECLAIGPNDEVYTCVNDSIYMSTDKGEHWKDISGNLSQGGFTSIACVGDRILIAAKNKPYMSGGLYRSTDNGGTWEYVFGKSAGDIQISNEGLIYAIAVDSLSRDGVFISSDSGSTWKQSSGETGKLSVSPNGTVFLCRDEGSYGMVFRYDQGHKWEKLVLTSTDPKLHFYGPANKIVFTSNGDCYGTFSNDSKDPYTLCKSTDNGNTWDYLDKVKFPNTSSHLKIVTTSKDEILVVDDNYSYRSSDSGKQWVKLGKIDGSYLLSYASDTKGTLYMGTFANIYRNDFGSDQFTTASPTMGVIRKIVSDQDGNLVASIWLREPKYYSDSSGVEWGYAAFAYSTNGGDYWNFNIAGPSYMNFGSPIITSLHADHDTVVVTQGNQISFYTTNGGRSWDQWPFLPMTDRFIREVTPVKYGRVYYVHSLNGPEVVYDSSRHGRGFYRDPNLPGELPKPNYHYLTIARSPDDYIYLGMYGKVAYMKDGDTLWQRCDITGLTDSVHSFAFIGNRVYALTSFNGIFESFTGGGQWAPMNSGLTSLAVRQLVSDPQGNLFVATKDGVFRRMAGTLTWENISSNIGSVDVTTLCYVPQAGLYAGTRGSGIFYAKFEPMEDVEPQQIQEKLYLSNDLSRSSITAHYSLAEPSQVTITIVNVLGVELWQTQEWASDRENDVAIPVRELPNGFYLIRVSTNDFSETATFVK